ncbi:MAG: ROK family protein [Planctomycetota bacterium]|jgi:fructokinase
MRIGVDLGGTKIAAVALAEDGAELARRRIAAPRDDVAATVDAIVGLVRDLETETGRTGTVGVGTPGTISPATGLLKNSNSTWLNGQPLDVQLRDALGRDVRLANDANCFALSEATDGAARDAAVVFGVILGTGVGGGVVVDGRVLGGPHGVAGEWGHNPLPWPTDEERPGPACYCGQSGCIETFLSGPALARAYGQDVAAPEIVRRAAAGDDAAETLLATYEHRLARALASVINLLDPDAIVLGGGLSNVDRLYDSVARLWSPFVFSDTADTRLVPALHGDASGVRGAAWLWPAGTG